MVDRNFVAKIADFHRLNHSRRGSSDFANLWLAPEFLALSAGASPGNAHGREHDVNPNIALADVALTTAADVYSFGVVCYECLSRLDPFDGMEVVEALDGVRSGKIRLEAPKGCDLVVAGTMEECLRTDPVRRPPFEELDRRFAAIDPTNIIPGGEDGNADPRLAWIRSMRRVSKLEFDALGQGAGSAALQAIIHSENRPGSAAAAFLTSSSSFGQSRTIRTESILKDLFPEHVATALIRGEKVPPERKGMVTMYFSGASCSQTTDLIEEGESWAGSKNRWRNCKGISVEGVRRGEL